MFEIERYELREIDLLPPALTRREFGGILILIGAAAAALGQRRQTAPQDVSAWLHISEEDGTVTVFTGKVEVGQNTRTALAQAVADELSLPVSSIRMVMADTELTPYDAGTFGSQSTPQMSPQLRRAAAAAREMLIDLAAEKWQVDRTAVSIRDGKAHAPANKQAGFGELTKGAKLQRAISSDVAPKPASEWTVAGRSLPKLNGRDFVTGRHKYSSDISVDGIVHGKVLRAPAAGSKLTSMDASKAESLPGVKVIRDGDFAGVTAPDAATASLAVGAIRAEWESTPQPNDAELFEHLKKTAREPRNMHTAGDARQALNSASARIERSYRIAYIAHAPLETRTAVAQWQDDKLTVWTGTQRPFGVRDELSRVFGIPADRVRVIVPDTGSAYGGKHTGEYAIEAARLARHSGKPVKLVWSREEEFTWAYFRPAGVIEVSAGASQDGVLSAWTFRNYNSGGSSIRTPYEVANQDIAFCECQSPLRQGSYRALAATANSFARECAMDELAAELKMDPLAFRLKNLKEPRLREVLERAATGFGWGKGTGKGVGLACSIEKGSFVASCAEIAMEQGAVRVKRVVTAYDCGPSVNPEHLKNQVEGAVIMGLGGALFEKIRFEGGRIQNARFSRYRVPRFADTPVLETILVDRKDVRPVGAGETPIIAIAPAIANAVYTATGKRIRSMPLEMDQPTPTGSGS